MSIIQDTVLRIRFVKYLPIMIPPTSYTTSLCALRSNLVMLVEFGLMVGLELLQSMGVMFWHKTFDLEWRIP